MKAFHLTEIINYTSINIHGLKPQHIILPEHKKRFKRYRARPKKAIYCWKDSGFAKNQKFARDMIYCKQWLSPRNKYCHDNYWEYSEDLPGPELYDEYYVLLSIDSDKQSKFYKFSPGYHDQYDDQKDQISTMNGMDKRFEHKNKELIIFTRTINPKHIQIDSVLHSFIQDKRFFIERI